MWYKDAEKFTRHGENTAAMGDDDDDEKDDIISGITDAAEAVSIIVKTGDVDKAMNKFNKKGQGKQ